jgi:DNA-binding response OmpR family regulator
MDKPKVLIVDDEPDIVEAIKFNLELEKIACIEAYEGVISEEQLESAEASANSQKKSLLKVLVELELITEEELISFIGEKTQTPYVNLTDYTVDRYVLDLIPEKLAR